MSDEALAATTNPEPAVSLTDILKAVQTGQREAQKAHDLDVKRFEKLFKQIGELGERMDTIDESIQNALSAFPPVNTQLRVSSQVQADNNPGLSQSVIQPQPQTRPAQYQQVLAAPALNTQIDDEEMQTRPRRNPTRKKSTAAKENPSTSTSQKPVQANKQRAKPGFDWKPKDTTEKRALDPSPPRIPSTRPSKPIVKRPAKSSAREQPQGASSDDGVDEIPAVAEEPKANKTSKKQQKPKRTKKTGDREAPHDFDDGEVALGAGDDDDSASTPVAKPSKKRKISRSDQIGDAEGRSHGRAPEKATSADAHADDENGHPRPKKKGKKSREAE